ncbi:C40 family peptidase [Flavivirga spongiicola]|uniref:C40 family peptidase n=1 Tax=Flavivirga spongiicola TaxID=421621 RepID=A0ABU7XVN2_9FLAO|nr:C40 family peptidase [Flavivirga sp. MEBiC05379]MDO5979812.1 C40 family peptidase [Flavivirga sp. MEBiC05379]
MKRTIFILLIIVSFTSCKSSKRARSKKQTSTTIISKKSKKETANYKAKSSKKVSKAENIVDYSKQFKGVRYKWGGTTKSGMDCSGLVFESFRAYDVILPRISRDMAKKGHKIPLKKTQEGDLLFFKTSKNRRHRINHVGLIIKSKTGDISFIHATTRKGVIVSKLSENYWKSAFVEARRIL